MKNFLKIIASISMAICIIATPAHAFASSAKVPQKMSLSEIEVTAAQLSDGITVLLTRNDDGTYEQKKNAHDHQNVCVALGGIRQPFHGSADGSFALFYRLFHAGPGGRCTVGCRFAACGLRRRARTGGGIVAFVDFLPLFPA